MITDKRPKLTATISLNDFKNFYWLKKELSTFCMQHGIPATGLKPVLFERILYFLETGSMPDVKQNSTKEKRKKLTHNITPETPVTNAFTCDSTTRAFFEQHIGPHFHFSVHLNSFRKKQSNLTYQDLINEWLAEYNRRKNKSYKPPITSSCEYNQFIRDFFADPKNQAQSLKDAIKAWNEIKKKYGPRKYRC